MTVTPARLAELPILVGEAVPGLYRPEPETYQERIDKLADEPLERAGRPEGLINGTIHSVRDIWGYRQLLLLLIRRELKARYKDSVFGFVWSLLKPLALLAVYYVAVGTFLGASKGTADFAIFIYTGITMWNLFSEILSTSTGSIIANSGLVKKIYLPREVFPLSTIGSALFNFVIQLMILMVATLIAGKPPTGIHLVYGVLAFALILVYGTALSFLLSAVNVYLRDVQYLIEIMLMFGMWTSPVVYTYDRVYASTHSSHPLLLQLYQANPITLAVEAFQRCFWVAGQQTRYIKPEHLGVSIVIELIIGVFLLWGCQRVFARLQDNFAQEI